MKKKVIMIGIVLIVCLGTVFYNMQKRDPYKSYKHLKISEVLKVKKFNQYWVYFYSMDDQKSIDSKNGIARLNKAVNNVYFVKMKDKEVNVENQKIKSATLLYIKNRQIIKEYKGLKQLKDHQDEILQISW